MTYEIKTYSEDFIEKQVEIGSITLGTWLGAQQTPLDRLKAAYSKDTFDPTTKFYALKDNQVVGFVTAGINENVANMEFPIVSRGHESVEKMLIDAAYTSFRERGISQVLSRASPRWGKTEEFVKEYGYEKGKILWISARLDVDKYTLDIGNEVAEQANLDTDLEEITKILMDLREMKEEAVQNYIESLKKITERITSWPVIRKSGIIVGHDILVQDKFDPNKARMNAIYAVGEDSELIRDKVMSAHVKAARAAGIKYLDSFFFGPTEQMFKDYAKYGFETADVTRYSKNL